MINLKDLLIIKKDILNLLIYINKNKERLNKVNNNQNNSLQNSVGNKNGSNIGN